MEAVCAPIMAIDPLILERHPGSISDAQVLNLRLEWSGDGTAILLSLGGTVAVIGTDGEIHARVRGVFGSWSPDNARIAISTVTAQGRITWQDGRGRRHCPVHRRPGRHGPEGSGKGEVGAQKGSISVSRKSASTQAETLVSILVMDGESDA